MARLSRSIVSPSRLVRASRRFAALVLALGALTAPSVRAQGPIDECGTLVPGVTCPKLFQSGSTGLLWVLSNYGSFQLGDFVRVTGTTDPNCITPCQQGGCILANTIDACVVCVCSGFCFGDGSGAACPCGNSGASGRGCANSVNPSGARLAATGNASLANDTVVLAGDGMPDSSALYFQGTAAQGGGAGVPFGDGLRCAGGTVLRLGTKLNAGGTSQYPQAGDASVSVRGMVTIPATRTYQVWYRNAAAFCTTSTFNLSNGFQVTWSA